MISVVVPVLNETGVLAPALQALLQQQGHFEVIVVDGGSTDGSAAIAAAAPGVRVVQAPRGRAMQMNAGAHAARGELLLILHADTSLPAGALARLDAAHAAGAWQAGAYRHSFAGADWRLRLVSRVNNLRCRRSRIYLGDQAIFVSRTSFDRIGGFPEIPVLEDVVFCERLRSLTRAVLLDETVQTDARRFRHHGVWRSTWRGIVILVRHRFGIADPAHGYVDEVR